MKVHSRRGLTLIEILAVVVILSAAAGIGIVSLSAIDTGARLDRIGFEWRDLDARLRVMAQHGEAGSSITIDDDGIIAENRAGELTASVALSDSIHAEIQITDPDVDRVGFDARGCTPDYTLTVRAEGIARRWEALGETGWIEDLAEVEQ